MKKYYLTSAHNLLNNDEPYEFTISEEKPITNRGHEIISGWLGTNNNTYNYALGEYDSVEEAKASDELIEYVDGHYHIVWDREPDEFGDITGRGYVVDEGELYEIVWHNPDNEWPEFLLKDGAFIAWADDPGNSGWFDDIYWLGDIAEDLPDMVYADDAAECLEEQGYIVEISQGRHGYEGTYVIAKKK